MVDCCLDGGLPIEVIDCRSHNHQSAIQSAIGNRTIQIRNPQSPIDNRIITPSSPQGLPDVAPW